MMSLYVKSEAQLLKEVVMCCPQKEYFLVNDKKAHNITELADKEKAILQHQYLVQVIRKFGANVVLIEELEHHPNSVFTRDTALTTPKGFIKLRMGIDSRLDEETWMAKFLENRGVPCIGTIISPGTVEGGDVILAGEVAFIGNSSRTNKDGISQIEKILNNQGYETRISPVPSPFLHIGGAMSIIDNNTVISVQGVFPASFFSGFTNITIPNDGFITGNVITLGDKELIVNRENIMVIDKLKHLGFKVHEVNLSEFTKGTGGPSCLIMPLSRNS